jgi:hypothetical protein
MDRVRLPELWRLTWRDVDPAARPGFDPAGVAELVRALPPAAEIPPAGTDRRIIDFWYDRMTAALVERLGDWVVGWWHTLAMEDYQDRGVVPVWRFAHPPVTTPAETLTRIADAVVAWHSLLVELATDSRGRFAAAPPVTDFTGDPPAWRYVRGQDQVTINTQLIPRRHPHPSQLTWADVDPAGRAFDPGTVAAVVADLVAASEIPSPRAAWGLQDLWLETVGTGLVDRYGQWTLGWRWSLGEADLDGGPIGSWCCFTHSVSTPEATAATISAALVEWHEWLGELAERFDRFLPLGVDDLVGWELAVAHLVTAVGDRTQYESAWYRCYRTVLGWFLEAAGFEQERRTELLEHAIAGRFHSWVEPPRAVRESVAEDLARRVARDHA